MATNFSVGIAGRLYAVVAVLLLALGGVQLVKAVAVFTLAARA